ncbi:MAG: glycosyltransferase, partial [Candidatus Eisenbacteria bacterium]
PGHRADAMSERTRVMYFSDAPYFGGAERYLELLISHLNREKYEPCFVMRRGAGLGAFPAALASSGVSVFETTLCGPYDVPGYLDLFSLVRRQRPEIMHVNLAGTYDAQASLVVPLAKAAGCRHVVSTEHLAMVEKLWKRHVAKRFSSLFLDRVVSITHSNVPFLTDVHGIKPAKVTVIHNGIDPAEIEGTSALPIRDLTGVEEERFVFAAVGSLIERKGHRFLLEAFARLQSRGATESTLLIVGQGSEEAPLKAGVRELGLQRRVFFLGQRSDIPAIMKTMDCLVVPSLVEGMPFVILEAMGAGKPVIASRIYGIPEVIREGSTGYLVSPGDPASLLEAMERMASNPEEAREMGGAGRLVLEEGFTAQEMARQVECVYDSLLRR